MLESKKSIPRWMLSALLSLGGMLIAGVLILIFFLLFPQFRPGYTVFTVSMGDIFFNTPEWIKPPENPNEVIATYWIGWDENGFRIPERQADHYPIVALGDSFTEAPNAPRPWTDVLAANSGIPVANLGYRALGPVEELKVFQKFGTQYNPDIVIIGFFEGNDLENAVTSQERSPKLPWETGANERQLIKTDTTTIKERDERYPMQVSINGVEHDIAFFEPYAWILNASRRSYERSMNMQITMESFRQMQLVVPDACLIVAYFPGAPHLYLPYLEAEDQLIMMQKAESYRAAAGQPLSRQFVPNAPFDGLLKRLSNQRDAMKAQVEAAGLIFFDLTPVFENAAAQGEMLYYTYDTHWNQAGHDLAGGAIADFLKTNPCGAISTAAG